MIPAPPTGTDGCDQILRGILPAGTVLYRFNPAQHANGLFFNTQPTGRWNDPAGVYGILYAADSVDTAFAESLGRNLTQRKSPTETKFLSIAELNSQHIWQITLKESLLLAELNGNGLPRLSLDAGIAAGSDYTTTQQWSAWIRQCPHNFHGIRYHARSLPSGLCLALYDTCRPHLDGVNLGPADQWQDPATGRSIDEILYSQGWALTG